jgi:Zn-dependent protease with chaperone function
MPLVYFITAFSAAFLLAFTLNWLALIPWRRSVGRHWTERARLLYPARFSAKFNNLLFPFAFGFLSYALVPQVNFFLAGVMAFLGALVAGFFFHREIFPALTFGRWIRFVIAALFIFLWWLVALTFITFAMPKDFGPATWLVAGAVFLMLLSFPYFPTLHPAKWFGLLLPATDSLKTLVAEVSGQMRVPVRATWILPTWICNAAALPHIRQLIFTDGLLVALTPEEVKAICAHELGHLSEPPGVRFARGLSLLAFSPLIFLRPLLSQKNDIFSALLILIGLCVFLFLALFLLIRLGHRMEKRADKMASENQSDGAIYARALSRGYEANLVPAVMPLRSRKVHPDLYDRMLAAGVTPDFPRPLPADKQSWTSKFVLICFAIAFVLIFTWKNLPNANGIVPIWQQ